MHLGEVGLVGIVSKEIYRQCQHKLYSAELDFDGAGKKHTATEEERESLNFGLSAARKRERIVD